jgi:hypothetical protein
VGKEKDEESINSSSGGTMGTFKKEIREPKREKKLGMAMSETETVFTLRRNMALLISIDMTCIQMLHT